jgi:drug/metabolite transporter (DMT)-like permease
MKDRPDRGTLIAFGLLVIFGGSNAVAVRFSNFDLPPFWGASIRFFAAGLVFWAILLARRIEMPRGRELLPIMLHGLLSIGISYAFLYWGLLRTPANLTMVVLAFVPLFTFFLAVLHRLETFRWRGLLGALVATAGITVGVAGGVGDEVHFPSILALLAGAACAAEGTVILKLYVKGHPVAVNAVGLTTGAAFLLLVSLVAREGWRLPSDLTTWAAFAYLVLIGSVAVFYLYLLVLRRWTASATSYSFLLFPIATVFISALLLDEAVNLPFLIGGALVLYGVWIGAVKGTEEEKKDKDKRKKKLGKRITE